MISSCDDATLNAKGSQSPASADFICIITHRCMQAVGQQDAADSLKYLAYIDYASRPNRASVVKRNLIQRTALPCSVRGKKTSISSPTTSLCSSPLHCFGRSLLTFFRFMDSHILQPLCLTSPERASAGVCVSNITVCGRSTFRGAIRASVDIMSDKTASTVMYDVNRRKRYRRLISMLFGMLALLRDGSLLWPIPVYTCIHLSIPEESCSLKSYRRISVRDKELYMYTGPCGSIFSLSY